MARPQMESGVDHRSRGRQHSCRMEVHRPDAWPGGSLHPHQAGYQTYQQYPNMNSQPSQDHAPPGREAPLPPSAPLQDTPGRESTDPERERHGTTDREALPDLLPQRERSPQASPQHRAPRRADLWWDDEVAERVAHQLRRIGDDLNATFVQRVDDVPQRQDWRGLCLGVLHFLSDTLSTLYRLI
ncbi:bcl-2-binding component 3 isoform X2 [Esox lucius]|nr:bcl-2-binding component 3 isoform X2 [Esox lucius]XP_019905032.2 bcl-2-binding component 3 isoform X2 [Esox lucius]XP_019905034.2 bcl-2-binding component 3 isoform X2 [Esox lucius]